MYLFEDYSKTKRVYHIVTLSDLDYALTNGIRYDDKITYDTKYKGFHDYIDNFKNKNVPDWLDRNKSIFASFNFTKEHYFHSHSAILSIKIDEDKCWVANENLANDIYEPYVLKDSLEFGYCNDFLNKKGENILKEYWDTSLSFKENLILRNDLKPDYDAEILICHPIEKEDIEVLYICSDHRMMSIDKFKKYFG